MALSRSSSTHSSTTYVTLPSTSCCPRKMERSGRICSSSRGSLSRLRVNVDGITGTSLFQRGFCFLNAAKNGHDGIHVRGLERLRHQRLRVDDHSLGAASVQRARAREQHTQPERCDEFDIAQVDDCRFAARSGDSLKTGAHLLHAYGVETARKGHMGQGVVAFNDAELHIEPSLVFSRMPGR